jgi:hypothetical protein
MLRLAVASAVLAAACSTTISVERPFSAQRMAEIESMLAGRNATVSYSPPRGEPVKDVASAIALTPEKARWTVWDSDFARERRTPPGQPVEAPIDAVRKITVCDAGCRARGALEGAGLGLLLGVVVGAIGAASCHGEYCVYWYASGPLLGIPLGTLIGLGAGHRTVVELEPPPWRR